MKKWEKPVVQNLALDYTQEEGIDPASFFPYYKCCACTTDYNILGNNFGIFSFQIQNMFIPKMSKWKCGNPDCIDKGPIVLYNGGQCS